MSFQPWLGLLAAGPMSPALFRLSNLHVHMGPVASASLRVASRLANRLKAGTATQPEGLGEAEMIFLSGPAAAFPDLLQLALHPALDWSGRTVVLLDSRRGVDSLASLAARGASVATLNSLDAVPGSSFVADADLPARRRLQRFAALTSSSIYFLNPGCKALFEAGAAFTSTLFTPLVATAVDTLKHAGLSQPEACNVAEKHAQLVLRSWGKSGRKGWSGPVADRDASAALAQYAALQTGDPVRAEAYVHLASLACRLLGEDTGWLEGIMEGMDDPRASRLNAAGRLAANLAHDWNNVLSLLAAQAAEIAQLLPAGHPAAPLAAELNASLAHAADPPRRLLQWLREEPGQVAEHDINALIRAALPLLRIALGGGVVCTLDLAEPIPPLAIDHALLLNALLNLASNSAIAMGGRGTFTIRTTTNAEALTLTVSDTGTGMDETTRAHVFDPFFSTTQSRGGTGLGLETVKSLAAAQNGTVEIDTSPGQGCCFTFTFPLK